MYLQADMGKIKLKKHVFKSMVFHIVVCLKLKKIHTEESNLKKYGVKHVNQVPEIK